MEICCLWKSCTTVSKLTKPVMKAAKPWLNCYVKLSGTKLRSEVFFFWNKHRAGERYRPANPNLYTFSREVFCLNFFEFPDVFEHSLRLLSFFSSAENSICFPRYTYLQNHSLVAVSASFTCTLFMVYKT